MRLNTINKDAYILIKKKKKENAYMKWWQTFEMAEKALEHWMAVKHFFCSNNFGQVIAPKGGFLGKNYPKEMKIFHEKPRETSPT